VYHLAGSESLGNNPLESQLLLFQIIGGGVFNLELGHSIAKSRLDLLLLATLQPDGSGGVGDHLLDTRDVSFELLSGLKLLAKCFITGLKLGSI